MRTRQATYLLREITPPKSRRAQAIPLWRDRRYLAAGGTVVEYGKRLTERQDAEIAIYNRVKADLDKARKIMKDEEFMTYWEKRNDELRNLGIKTVGLEP